MKEFVMIEIIPKININIIEETLTRIGVCDKKNKIIYPSCVLFKDVDSKYYLCHFKEMFELRKTKPSYFNLTEDDLLRLNSVALLLEDWNMLDLIDFPEEVDTVYVGTIPFNQKHKWIVKHKFNMRSM
jgi:hypothetical protein